MKINQWISSKYPWVLVIFMCFSYGGASLLNKLSKYGPAESALLMFGIDLVLISLLTLLPWLYKEQKLSMGKHVSFVAEIKTMSHLLIGSIVGAALSILLPLG